MKGKTMIINTIVAIFILLAFMIYDANTKQKTKTLEKQVENLQEINTKKNKEIANLKEEYEDIRESLKNKHNLYEELAKENRILKESITEKGDTQ